MGTSTNEAMGIEAVTSPADMAAGSLDVES